MEDYLRLGIIVIVLVLLFWLTFSVWHKRNRRVRMAQFSPRFQPLITTMGYQEFNINSLESASFSPSAKKEPSFAAEVMHVPTADANKHDNLANDLLVISVLAQSGCHFAAYDLLQAITATGLRFGDMNIFHYREEGEVLFSLASATEPGEFDLDHIGDFSCNGLTLFMNLREASDPQHAFELMLATAEQLAEDLEGELRAGHHTPWSEDILKQYEQKVLQFRLGLVQK